MIRKAKVLVYLVARNHLLVNFHIDFPEAGFQVPGGSIEPGELAEAASIRELFEESGLVTTVKPNVIDRYEFHADWDDSTHDRTVVLFSDNSIIPVPFEHTVSSGSMDKGIRLSYFWVPVYAADLMLEAGHGLSIHLITDTN